MACIIYTTNNNKYHTEKQCESSQANKVSVPSSGGRILKGPKSPEILSSQKNMMKKQCSASCKNVGKFYPR